MVEMFSEMGVLGSTLLHDALLRSSEATTPGPSFDIDNVNIETSALRMPWWKDVSVHQSLLPGLYETIQVLQALDIRQEDDVLIIGPRSNWWTEIAMQLGHAGSGSWGPSKKGWLSSDPIGLSRLDQAAEAPGAKSSGGWLDPQGRPASGRWDRILITGAYLRPQCQSWKPWQGRLRDIAGSRDSHNASVC